jgi:hypothetical protein
MRGQRTLFDELMTNELKAKIANDGKQRPRNVLMPDRNTLLIHRYYYYVQIVRLQFEDALSQLEKEFFIVSDRIVVVMSDNDTQFRSIIQAKPDRATLKKLYPYINWEYSPR